MYLFINAFIIFHLFLITTWLFPVNHQLLDLLNVFRGYVVFWGLDQDYSMFAPEPRKKNRSLFALITFRDQSSVIWLYPRMERLPYWQSIYKERYRKFGNDNIVEPYFKIFLPDFARYIALLHSCSANEANLVSIYVSEKDIIEPQIAFKSPNNIETSSQLIKLFTYKVNAIDLRTK